MPTPFFADLVRELAQEGGTGPLTPTGAVPGHRRFSGVVPPGVSFHYAIAGIAHPAEWEVGTGRIGGDGRLLRDAVAASSAGGAAVDFAVGLKTIALTVAADWFAATDAQAAVLAGEVAGLGGELASLSDAIAARQPISTSHGSAEAGEASDTVTVRRGAGWVNVPLSALAFRDAGGRYSLDGVLHLAAGSAANPALVFDGDFDTGLCRVGADSIGFAVGGALAAHFNAQGRLVVGAGTANYRANVAEANPSRGIVADIANTHASPNGAMLSFTQNGINNWCIGQVPGVDAFAIYRGRNGAADGSEMLRVTSAGSVGIGTGAPAARLHILSGGEIQRLETTTARGGGACYQGFYDPSGAKGFCGYSAIDDGFDIWNSLNHQIRFGTGGAYRWAISSAGGFYPVADNAYTIGGSVNRVSEIYAVNGTINTSDARDKSWRGAPTEAELRAARRIAGELGFFQWNDALAEKGADGARLHFGVRTQAVWAIMAEERLIEPIGQGADPTSRYAFLCWDKWDAIEPVDAVDAVLDEEGRVIAEARPAQPGRDAGERFGVRADQLALFLIAAQDARIAALEAAA